jgi:hypothetical protein
MMENQNIKKKKSEYESTKLYTKSYNKKNINVQLDRDLVNSLREKISPISLKDYLEGLIRGSL